MDNLFQASFDFTASLNIFPVNGADKKTSILLLNFIPFPFSLTTLTLQKSTFFRRPLDPPRLLHIRCLDPLIAGFSLVLISPTALRLEEHSSFPLEGDPLHLEEKKEKATTRGQETSSGINMKLCWNFPRLGAGVVYQAGPQNSICSYYIFINEVRRVWHINILIYIFIRLNSNLNCRWGKKLREI